MTEARPATPERLRRPLAGIRSLALLVVLMASACATQDPSSGDLDGMRSASDLNQHKQAALAAAGNELARIEPASAAVLRPDPPERLANSTPRSGFIRIMATEAVPEEPAPAEQGAASAEPPRIDPARLPPGLRPPDWPVLPDEGGPDGYADKDPLEGMNRVFFYANGALDFLIFEPLAQGYRAIVPPPARHAVSRAFDNLSLPIVFANDLLQGEMEHAGQTFGRFLVNTTIGLFGLFDVASEVGIEGHWADFGQTLESYGVGDGIYLVLPLLGPTTVRDAVGSGVDTALDPRTWLLGSTERLGLAAGHGVVRRESVIDQVDFLVDNSEDNYESVRAWTFQQRQRVLYGTCDSPTLVVCPGYGH